MTKMYVVPEYLVKKYIPGKFLSFLKEIETQDFHIYATNKLTTSETARRHGMKNFDVALPVSLVRSIIELTGKSPVGHCVMDYSISSFGILCPITREGQMIVDIWEHVKNLESEK